MLKKSRQKEESMNKVLKTGKWSGYDNSDVVIVAEHKIGDEVVYTFYSYNKGGSYSRAAAEITVTGNMEKKDTEIYPWDTFKPEERLDINYLNELDSYDELDMTKEELVLLLMQYHTALNRGEEIIKRSIGLEDNSSDEEVVPKKGKKESVKLGIKSQLENSKIDVYDIPSDPTGMYKWHIISEDDLARNEL